MCLFEDFGSGVTVPQVFSARKVNNIENNRDEYDQRVKQIKSQSTASHCS